ncbi:MAG: hypothetical protein KGJ57_21300 [Sphingomonadales bacterium]|nr:hypothetical protein [Sphingomonadales bacterium]MDE2171930.1 hypothetical protein [Sphingomonadales bacterium]
MEKDDASCTPQEQRRANTAARLKAALDRLVAAGAKLTVAELAREAGVGRNAIYVNHRTIIAELIAVASRRDTKARPSRNGLSQTDWRAEVADLKEQLRATATENALLLKRALDAEQAMARAERRQALLEESIRELRLRQRSL